LNNPPYGNSHADKAKENDGDKQPLNGFRILYFERSVRFRLLFFHSLIIPRYLKKINRFLCFGAFVENKKQNFFIDER
jgi:hypothetical protein